MIWKSFYSEVLLCFIFLVSMTNSRVRLPFLFAFGKLHLMLTEELIKIRERDCISILHELYWGVLSSYLSIIHKCLHNFRSSIFFRSNSSLGSRLLISLSSKEIKSSSWSLFGLRSFNSCLSHCFSFVYHFMHPKFYSSPKHTKYGKEITTVDILVHT